MNNTNICDVCHKDKDSLRKSPGNQWICYECINGDIDKQMRAPRNLDFHAAKAQYDRACKEAIPSAGTCISGYSRLPKPWVINGITLAVFCDVTIEEIICTENLHE
jgi:hypothetical protein